MAAKKVLFIAPRFHTNQFFLTKLLIERQVEVNFLTVYQGGSENHRYLKPIPSRPSRLVKQLLRKRDPKIAKHRNTLRKYHITSFVQCLRLYRDLKPEILIIRNLRLLISIQHFLIGLLSGKKIFLYTQNPFRQRISFARRLFYKMLKVAGVKHFTPVYGQASDPAIPNTVYLPFVMENLVAEETVLSRRARAGIRVVTIGKLMVRKNIKELIRSLNRIGFFDNKENMLVIIGECISRVNHQYLEVLKNEISAHESQVEFNLNIKHEQVMNLLQGADLFVLPSHDEPAAFSLLEAMACGLAVISSDRNGTHCYIEREVNGMVFKYTEDFKELDQVLINILDKDKLQKYGLASLEQVRNQHGISSFYNAIIET